MNMNSPQNIEKTLGLDRSPHHRRRKLWLIIGSVMVVVVVGLVLLIGGGDKDGVKYKTAEARRGDMTVTVTATGNLQPTNQVEVGSELSGIVDSVDVDYNDTVKVGQVLAELDTTKLKALVQQSKAMLASARARVLQGEATLRESSDQLSRLKRLRRSGNNQLVSQQDLDTANATYQRAKADVEMSKASVAQASATLETQQTELAKAVIRSPVNGIVLARSVEPGQTVAASLQAPVLFTLAEDLKQMQLHVDVDEADVGRVHEGQEATFTVDAYPDRTFRGKISQVRYGSKTVDGVVTYETVIDVDNSDLALRPGMTATAEIVVQKVHDALLIPNSALRFSPPNTVAAESHGNFFSRIFSRRRPSESRSARNESGLKPKKEVWTLRDRRPRVLTVETGPSDGVMTVVTGGGVKAGMPLLIDVVTPAK